MVLGAQVWHYWIGFVLAVSAILVVMGIVVAYLITCVRPKYRGQDPDAVTTRAG